MKKPPKYKMVPDNIDAGTIICEGSFFKMAEEVNAIFPVIIPTILPFIIS